jgi:hypothetical protein
MLPTRFAYELAVELLTRTRENGGATLLKNGDLATKGYATGVGQEYKIETAQGLKFTPGQLKDVAECVELILANETCNSVGFWYNEGTLYIDAVLIFEDLEDALELGRIKNEIAIYDLNNQKEIKL